MGIVAPMNRARLENANTWLENVHERGQCLGAHCTIHNRSEHHMRGFPQRWRDDRGIMERVNPFGGACPDPDSPWPDGSAEWIHGCIVNPYAGKMMCSPWQIDGVAAAWATSTMAVTKDGRVWSFRPLAAEGKVDTSVPADYTVDPVPVSTELRRGHWSVTLPPYRHPVHVAKVVLTGWRGTRPGGHRVDYVDGNRDNVALANLQWVPMRSDATMGHRTDRFTLERVKQARVLYAGGMDFGAIRKELGITVGEVAVRRAVVGERWGWVDDPPPVRLRPGDYYSPVKQVASVIEP